MNTYLNELFNLDGRVAAVTGAGGYLCSEMARGFARAGCAVAVLDLRLEKAQAVEAELKAEGFEQVVALAIDVAKKEQHVAALDAILARFGQLDILVNGAGTNGPTPFLDLSLEEWYSILDSQLTGTFLGCQVFGGYMVSRGKGTIINISSASAGPPLSKAFTYSIAKAGILNLTQNLGREWGPRVCVSMPCGLASCPPTGTARTSLHPNARRRYWVTPPWLALANRPNCWAPLCGSLPMRPALLRALRSPLMVDFLV